MAKFVADEVMDAALDVVATSTRMFMCSAAPASYAEAATTYNLATATLTGAAFTKGDGASSGRKFTVAQQSSVPVTASGTATHVALGVAASSKLLVVTTCTSRDFVSGDTVTIPAFSDTISDPT